MTKEQGLQTVEITYQQLRGWRDTCEYLQQAWYKFVEIGELKEELPHIWNSPIWEPAHREELWSSYYIQFIRWGQHPACNYSSRHARNYKGVVGWTLVSDWEYKIDFLEKLVLFNADPGIQPARWLPGLELRQINRLIDHFIDATRFKRFYLSHEDRQREIETIRKMGIGEVRTYIQEKLTECEAWQQKTPRELVEGGFCYHCKTPTIPLMLDCHYCNSPLDKFDD